MSPLFVRVKLVLKILLYDSGLAPKYNIPPLRTHLRSCGTMFTESTKKNLLSVVLCAEVGCQARLSTGPSRQPFMQNLCFLVDVCAAPALPTPLPASLWAGDGLICALRRNRAVQHGACLAPSRRSGLAPGSV